MQLNPARGRKLVYELTEFTQIRKRGLCSSTPRGDGNLDAQMNAYNLSKNQVYAAQPREGTETYVGDCSDPTQLLIEVYAAQPREGTETMRHHTCHG